MILDTVLTVAIGRNLPNGTPLSDGMWRAFRADVRELSEQYGTVVAATIGYAVGSDGVNDGATEETAVFVVINVRNVARLRQLVAYTLDTFGMSSACFAFDGAHEPCFPTDNGFRQAEYAPESRTFPLYQGATSPVARVVMGA